MRFRRAPGALLVDFRLPKRGTPQPPQVPQDTTESLVSRVSLCRTILSHGGAGLVLLLPGIQRVEAHQGLELAKVA